MTISFAGCADGRFILAVQQKAKADMVDEALAVRDFITLPPLPDDCRKREYSGVKKFNDDGTEMSQKEAALRSDIALTRANARVKRCASWYDKTKADVEQKQIQEEGS